VMADGTIYVNSNGGLATAFFCCRGIIGKVQAGR
jgi:hypothetical protein